MPPEESTLTPGQAGPSAAEPRLTLLVTAGPHAGQTYRLGGRGSFVVGRGEAAQVSLPDDPHLSRSHCVIELTPSARVIDQGSRHGTFHNGARVERADLSDGDEVRAGQTTLRVAMARPAGVESTVKESPAARPDYFTPDVPGYSVVRKRGEGGMGVVYQAHRDADGRAVALKLVQPAVQPRSAAVARFLREVRLLAGLSHPHIVRFLDSGESGALLWFAMEYVDGPSAAEAVECGGPLAPERVVALGGQLLDALAYAHAQGVVHRDLKPANLLLAEGAAESLKLADFGLARVYEQSELSGLTLSGARGGTPAFMPPEQVTDFRHARPPADQYGAAATLYYLLTGEHVYEPAQNSYELMRRIQSSEPVPLRGGGPPLPGGLAAVLRRALARRPEQRYPDVLAMRGELLARGGR